MLSRTFEICFLVDLCVTMEKWIEKFKKITIPTIQNIKKRNMWMTIRVAFIGYRNVYHNWCYDIVDFTENLQMLQDKFLVLNASGGKGCKCLNTVYHHAYTLDWSCNNKLIIHIGDSPNHGVKYHEPGYPDIFPMKHDYHFPLEMHVRKMAEEGIYLCLFKLSNDTNNTFDIIESTYMKYCTYNDRFSVQDLLMYPDTFNDSIIYTITELFYRAS